MKSFILKIFLFLILINGSLSKAEINFEVKTAILQDFLSGKVLYEMEGVSEKIAREAFRLASAKLPVMTAFITRVAM